MESDATPATSEPWWDDFVRDYRTVPLRELARRFNTNPRRLRRAAQRTGLVDEPEALRVQADRLGKVPDATLADELETTSEQVKGARKRRNIPPFNDSRAAAAPAPTARPAPKRKKRRFEQREVPVVVKKRATRQRPVRSATPTGFSAVADVVAPPVAPSKARERSQPRERKARRRLVRRNPLDDVGPSAPEPSAKATPRRRAPAPKAAPVRVVYDRNDLPAAVVAAVAADVPPPPPPAVAIETRLAEALVPKPATPRIATREAPQVAAEIAPPQDTTPASYWEACIDGADRIVMAPTLEAAAQRAAVLGTVTAIREIARLA